MPITKADREAWQAAKERYEQSGELTSRDNELLWGDGRTPDDEPDWDTVDEGLPEEQRPMG